MRKELLAALGFFIIISSIFFYPIFKGNIPFPGDLLLSFYEPYRAYPILGYPPGGVPSKAQGVDVARHIFPWKHLAIETYKNGEIPFWNPHNFSGNPLMANFQTGAFYPFNLILLILPFLVGWTIYILSTPIFAAFFMYLFLRELKLSKISSVFGGISFEFSSFMVVWMEYGNIGHTLLWLPLALFWTEKLIKRFEYKYIIYLTLTFLASLLAGFIQVYFYVVIIVLGYFIAKSLLNDSLTSKKLFLFLTSLLFSSFISFFQIFPTLEIFANSSRGNYTLSQIQNLLNPWWYSITAIVPNFFGHPASNNHWFYGTYIERVSYIGLIPFTLFLYALFNFKKRKEIIVFGLIGIFSFLLATDLFITKYFFKLPIPVISTAVPTRILSIFQFCAIVLSAIGLDYFRRNYNKKSLYISGLIVFSFIAVSWIFTFIAQKFIAIDPININIVKRNLIIPTALFLSFIAVIYLWTEKKLKIAILAILLITVLDLFYFFHRITPFSPKEFIYPKTPVIEYLQKNAGINRFWGYGSGYIESNFQTFDGTFSPEGVDPLHIREYTELITSSKNGKIASILPRHDANIVGGYGKEDLRNNMYRQKLLNLLGVKYVLHKIGSNSPDYETFSVGTYEMVWSDEYYQIYRNKEALPRIFLASDYVVEKDKQEIVDKIYESNLDLGKTLILSEKIKESFKPAYDPESKVIVKAYKSNKIELSTSSREDSLLFISDTYFPGWKVRIDGKDGKIYRANLAFRAIPVPKGMHEVILEFYPETFEKGLSMSLIAFLVFLGLGVYSFKKKNV